MHKIGYLWVPFLELSFQSFKVVLPQESFLWFQKDGGLFCQNLSHLTVQPRSNYIYPQQRGNRKKNETHSVGNLFQILTPLHKFPAFIQSPEDSHICYCCSLCGFMAVIYGRTSFLGTNLSMPVDNLLLSSGEKPRETSSFF